MAANYFADTSDEDETSTSDVEDDVPSGEAEENIHESNDDEEEEEEEDYEWRMRKCKDLSCAHCGCDYRDYMDHPNAKCSVCKKIYHCHGCSCDHYSKELKTHVLPAMEKKRWTCDGCKRDTETNLGCYVCGTRFLLQGDTQIECRSCPGVFHAECVKNPPSQGRGKKWLCPECQCENTESDIETGKRKRGESSGSKERPPAKRGRLSSDSDSE